MVEDALDGAIKKDSLQYAYWLNFLFWFSGK
jgi:hypothetical protein